MKKVGVGIIGAGKAGFLFGLTVDNSRKGRPFSGLLPAVGPLIL